jgi:hypothetical protein
VQADRATLKASLDQAIQNGLEASKSTVQRDMPISCRHLSLRVINSLRERAR